MKMENVFDQQVSDKLVQRIQKLTPTTSPQWGKMDVAQMLAHCSVTYEMAYENKHKKPNPLMRMVLKAFVKKLVTSETPYKHNSPTSPAFKMVDARVFDTEQKRLTDYIHKTQQLGASYFDDKESLSFGKLSAAEWNNMFYKHLDHHLTQFGV